MDAVVTYFPECDAFVAGEHRSKPDNWERLEMRSLEIEPIGTATFDAQCCNHNMMKLIRTYCKIKKFQQERLYLDRMFDPDLSRRESDGHGEIPFDSQNADSYDVPVSLIDNARSSSHFSDFASALLYEREQRACASLEQLKYHYQKDAKDDAMKFRRTAAPADNGVQRISSPACNDTGNGIKTLIEIKKCRVEFAETFKRIPNRFACSVNTAINLTRGTSAYEEIV